MNSSFKSEGQRNEQSLAHTTDTTALVSEPEISSPEFEPHALETPRLEVDRIETDRSLPTQELAHEATIRDNITIPLLAERIVTDYHRRKIGEVVIRKTIETRMIQVPVRYEKLIVEQVSPEPRQLAELDLSATDGDLPSGLNGDVELSGYSTTVSGEFTSARVASQVLYELGKTLQHDCKRVRVEIELEDANLGATYQRWIDEFSQQFDA